MDIIKSLSQEFEIKVEFIENIVELIDSGATIPFIARYRKEKTNSCDDQKLREIYDRLIYLRNLEERKAQILSSIEEQGKLTEELAKKINEATVLSKLEDLYLPYRPKRRTRATIAAEKGLTPLAEIIFAQTTKDSIEELAKGYINDEVADESEAISGALDIIAEMISDSAEYREIIRDILWREALISSKGDEEKESVYKDYYDFSQAVKFVPSHRILAINRGEKEDFLKVTIEHEAEKVVSAVGSKLITKDSTTKQYLQSALEDSYSRLLFPSMERELRAKLTEIASEKAIDTFALNLKPLLLQPPVKGEVGIGVDPAFRTGCKIAVVDSTGKLLEHSVIYPTMPHNKTAEAAKIMLSLIKKHSATVIAIGNGTASRETEMFIVEMLKENSLKIPYVIVNESGASVYSASKLAAAEFPELDVSIRSAISIIRRLQDPLAELVKIDPKSIGVGQYQHDMPAQKLDNTLEGVVEYCVNSVGVDLNTASPSLLGYISGLNATTAKNIVIYREENGAFASRAELKKVPRLGPKAYEQAAGFLRIPNGKNLLDNTAVHPESYDSAKLLMKKFEIKDEGKLSSLGSLAEQYGINKLAEELSVGVPTLRDVIAELQKPGRDPRDELPAPLLRTDVLEMKDLTEGMELKGTVRNVVDFGVFVDIGVHQDGLVHISQISQKRINHPSDVLSVGDIVSVKVMSVDIKKKRIALTMK